MKRPGFPLFPRHKTELPNGQDSVVQYSGMYPKIIFQLYFELYNQIIFESVKLISACENKMLIMTALFRLTEKNV